MQKMMISGFADEISKSFDEQLAVVKSLGMEYISLRSADGKNIAEFTVDEVQESLLPRLQKAGVKVSSIGSPTGKVSIEDENGFKMHLAGLERLCAICKVLECRYIRIFSFYIPAGKNADDYKEAVIQKLRLFANVAEKYDVVLLHENEKDIFGDTGHRCKEILDAVGSVHFKAAFDFANFVQCGENTVDCWNLLKEHIAYIHIKDAVTTSNENVLCGTGDGNLALLLRRAICDEGYEGFLTLEPHLVLFDALGQLETAEAKDIIKKNKYATSEQGYAAQYNALCAILKSF